MGTPVDTISNLGESQRNVRLARGRQVLFVNFELLSTKILADCLVDGFVANGARLPMDEGVSGR